MPKKRLPSIQQRISEGTTNFLDVWHRNGSGTLTAPTTLHYRIDDLTNEREILDWTAVSTPSTYNEITISGSLYNTLQDRDEAFEVRQITVRTTDGASNPYYQEFYYQVNRRSTDESYAYP